MSTFTGVFFFTALVINFSIGTSITVLVASVAITGPITIWMIIHACMTLLVRRYAILWKLFWIAIVNPVTFFIIAKSSRLVAGRTITAKIITWRRFVHANTANTVEGCTRLRDRFAFAVSVFQTGVNFWAMLFVLAMLEAFFTIALVLALFFHA
jgi:hypothetical protein